MVRESELVALIKPEQRGATSVTPESGGFLAASTWILNLRSWGMESTARS